MWSCLATPCPPPGDCNPISESTLAGVSIEFIGERCAWSLEEVAAAKLDARRFDELPIINLFVDVRDNDKPDLDIRELGDEGTRFGEGRTVWVGTSIDNGWLATSVMFLPVFLEESTELVKTIYAQLGAWRAAPADEGAQQALARALHTLKGNGREYQAAVVEIERHKDEIALFLAAEPGGGP